MKKIKISGVGAVVVDVISVLENFPNEDEKKEAINTIISTGGPVFTALSIASKLGAEVSILSPIAKDIWFGLIEEDLNLFGFNYPFVCNGNNHFANVWVNSSSGSRTISWQKPVVDYSVVDMNLLEKTIKNSDILFLDGHHMELAIESAKIAKKYAVPILYDAGSHKNNEECLFDYVTYFIASSRFFGKNYKEEMLQFKNRFKMINSLVVTLGEHGSIFLNNDGQFYNILPKKCDTIVDSTGAGDVFHGVFGYYILQTDVVSSLKKASYYASQSCKFLGSVNSVKKVVIE